MSHYRRSGAVSIFLCSILLSLTVFVCSIVDITRIHMAQLQATQALQLAGKSILASYDSQLQSQYGLFAQCLPDADTLISDLSRYMDASLQPTHNLNSLQLYDYQYEIQNLNTNAFLSADTLRLQILEFMKYRAPYQAIEPFLERFNVLSEAVKSSTIIQQKNQVVSQILDIQYLYTQLMTLIDGIKVDGAGKLVNDVDGVPIALTSNYVRILYVEDTVTSPVYSQLEMPIEDYRKKLESNVMYVDRTLQNYGALLRNCSVALQGMSNTYEEKKLFEVELLSNETEIENYTEEIERLEGLDPVPQDQVVALENNIENLVLRNQEVTAYITDKDAIMKYQAEDFLMNDRLLYSEYLLKLKGISGSETGDPFYGLMAIHTESQNIINEIQTGSESLKEDILVLKAILTDPQNGYDPTICQNLMLEVEKYESLLGLNENGLDILNNVAVMDEAIESNIGILEQVNLEVINLEASKRPIYQLWIDTIIGSDLEKQEEILSYLVGVEGGVEPVGNPYDDAISSLNTIENLLDGYRRDIYLDYRNMPEAASEGVTLESLQMMAEKLFPGFHPINLFKTMKNHLPSEAMGGDNTLTESDPDITMEGSIGNLGFLTEISNIIESAALDIRNNLYINEYALGMFRCATDEEQAVTLTHFPMKDHYLNYETEYILFGYKEDIKNVMSTVGVLFALRIGLNTISLVADCQRMEQITNTANIIAGWWTLGIGGFIVGAILTLIWAVVESVSDVQKLMNGSEVPVLKTHDTWETDILSNLTETATDMAQEAVEETIEDEEKEFSLIPCLTYKDYLRLLLLTVDEEKKLYRIMDLVQTNESYERGTPIVLGDYLTGFTAKAKISVDYLFFKLPFMPDTLKDIDGSYEFEKTLSVTY